MARIFPICSSSSANATFIGTKGHGILIDAGCSFRALKNSLELIDTSMSQIEAVGKEYVGATCRQHCPGDKAP